MPLPPLRVLSESGPFQLNHNDVTLLWLNFFKSLIFNLSNVYTDNLCKKTMKQHLKQKTAIVTMIRK
jgi:hypothetical protein